jgi:hypothetical protein
MDRLIDVFESLIKLSMANEKKKKFKIVDPV